MSERKRTRFRRKKKFLMGVKEYWLIEETLMPTYAHLVDSYSEKVKNELLLNIEASLRVKQEDVDDSSVDGECTTNSNKV